MTREELITAYLAANEIPVSTVEMHLAGTSSAAEVVGRQFDLCLAEFSNDVPQRDVKTGTADGQLILLDGWFYGSRARIESPEGSRHFLPDNSYAISVSGELIAYQGLDEGSTYRIEYSRMHALPDTGAVTIPRERHAAFFRLVTARLLGRIAAVHGETRKPEIGADSVDYQSKAREYLSLAREAYLDYRRLVGLPEKSSTPRAAGGFVSIENPSRIMPQEAPWPSR